MGRNIGLIKSSVSNSGNIFALFRNVLLLTSSESVKKHTCHRQAAILSTQAPGIVGGLIIYLNVQTDSGICSDSDKWMCVQLSYRLHLVSRLRMHGVTPSRLLAAYF